jgi:hypothetical protein
MFRYRMQRIEGLLHRLASIRSGRAYAQPRPLQSPRDVIDLLQEQVDLLRSDTTSSTVERARAIGYLAGIACKAIETSNLAGRLEILESILKKRKD